MTMTTITLATDCNWLGVFLHLPGQTPPEPLPGVHHSIKRDLSAGSYAISVAGSGNEAGKEVKVSIKTQVNDVSDAQQVSDDGTIIAWFPFDLDANGKVS